MSQRPLILQSQLLRVLCPLQSRSSSYVTQTNQANVRSQGSLQPTPISISDDQIAQLASTPLHSLTLADLVR